MPEHNRLQVTFRSRSWRVTVSSFLQAPEGRHKAAAGGVIRPKGDITVTACKRTQ
ncbi:MAG: hypothetical protein K5787_04615 [Lentisphaeria bacterium]|nr:hypothetical protein [Lentisphaeria bacterium]